MPKTEVYQLRLTSEEKKRLAHLAQEKDLSIAQMIRKDYGLDAETKPLRDNPHVSPDHSASEIKRLAMQRHGHLPLVFAERKVREELG